MTLPPIPDGFRLCFKTSQEQLQVDLLRRHAPMCQFRYAEGVTFLSPGSGGFGWADEKLNVVASDFVARPSCGLDRLNAKCARGRVGHRKTYFGIRKQPLTIRDESQEPEKYVTTSQVAARETHRAATAACTFDANIVLASNVQTEPGLTPKRLIVGRGLGKSLNPKSFRI